MKIIDEIKREYSRNKVVTGFMGLVVVLAFLTYLKPSSTSGILAWLGISMNLLVLGALGILIWFFWRKRK